jgi:hypothetical protein
MVRDQIIFAALDELSRRRALNPAESELMELTMHRLDTKRDYWQWTPDEDRMVRRLIIRRRQRKHRTKPFQANAEVAVLATQLGRSFWSVQRRLERLNKRRAKRQVPSSQMFKRMNGHAVLDCGDETQKTPPNGGAEPHPSRGAGNGAAGGTGGDYRIEEDPRGETQGPRPRQARAAL